MLLFLSNLFVILLSNNLFLLSNILFIVIKLICFCYQISVLLLSSNAGVLFVNGGVAFVMKVFCIVIVIKQLNADASIVVSGSVAIV